jgi:ubiquinone/menaquinone biosynthesis C-methylase UbiE
LLDLGCGLGRITVAAAPHFDSVVGVDISARMLEQARTLDPPENVSFVHITTADLPELTDGSFDFAGCFSVFQHIPDESVIATYVKAIGRVLRPGARAILHFNTASESTLRRLVLALPDWMLPRKNRRFMRRSRRDPERVRELIAQAGLTVEEERDPASVLHHFLVRRPEHRTAGAAEPPASV